ncbi:hypothetical protein [Puniceicoccus vermicola]|uniref:Glycoside hydrolase family 42 N-terminal domain-containing protein n=1 Tax=Puniceicoccus vermicola TaxID=388746 RepID=A0A7X1AX18_9BACT|nr:hypothetical protein [Puniceicoccus vermicola]MBC2601583.1 hypothetical protein [Puniceicoccus vermicola]
MANTEPTPSLERPTNPSNPEISIQENRNHGPAHPFMAYRSFWPQKEAVAQFAGIGIDTICIYPSNTLNSLGVQYSQHPPNWTHFGVYKWENLDCQFDEILEANPKARFICMVDLNTPNWLTRYSRYDDSFYNLGKVVSDARWRKETAEYMNVFLEHCETHYGDHIDSYILCAGATCEWQDSSNGQESPSRIEAWRNWCHEHDIDESSDLPSRNQRGSAAHGLLRDPKIDKLGRLYWDFNRNQIADTILHFARKAQSILRHRAKLGVFYGYLLEHGKGRLVSYGHLGYDKVFSSPDIDFFVSPGTYFDREMGGASGFMSLIDSMKLHGKYYIRELDHFTHTANGNPLLPWGIPWGESWNHRWPDELSSIAGLQREFSIALTAGVSLWWFDMWNHWYEATEVIDALNRMKEIWMEQAQDSLPPSAKEIAVIVDAESCLHLNENHEDITKVLRNIRKPLGRIGAPYSLYSFADIDRIDFSHYKLVIFPNLFSCDNEKSERIRQYVAKNNRTILWIHRAGVISGESYNETNIKNLTGVSYEPGTIGEYQFDHWKSILHADLMPSYSFLREVAGDAGVHLYGDGGEPVYANSNLLATHTTTGGKRKFRLPYQCLTVRELFSNRIVANDCREFEDTLSSPGSALYSLEW